MTAPNAPISAALAEYEDRLRGRAGPFTAEPGERYVDADIAKQVLRETVAAMAEREAALREDAERWRLLKAKATKKTAHDIYGNGAFWSIGIHSEDQRLDFEAVIDAARAEAHRGKGGAA